MLGTILFVDEATGTAIVRADDGKRYRFPISDWPPGASLTAGGRVDFDAEGDRALAPVPVTDAIFAAVTAPRPPAEPAATPMPDADASEPPTPTDDLTTSQAALAINADRQPAISPGMAMPIETTEASSAAAAETAAMPEGPSFASPQAPSPETIAAADAPIAPTPIPARMDEVEGPVRPLSFGTDDVPDYVDTIEPARKSGGLSALYVVGGVVLLLMLFALAFMMWDNAETAGFAEPAAEESGATVSMFAQEDLPVRNVAAMTNATVLGRIARGDRVTGVEVPGSADPQSRWLQLDGGNRFVPMTGLGASPPPAAPVAPVVPPPVQPADGVIDGQAGTADGGFADGPAMPAPIAPVPPPVRPAPVRPSPPPPPRDVISPSRPQETRPVGPLRPIAPQRPSDPRDTEPVN